MPSHRLDPDDESGSLERLRRAMGMTAGGWTPAQPDVGEHQQRGGRGVLVTSQPSALTWLIIDGLAVLEMSGFPLSRHPGSASSSGPSPHAAAPGGGAP